MVTDFRTSTRLDDSPSDGSLTVLVDEEGTPRGLIDSGGAAQAVVVTDSTPLAAVLNSQKALQALLDGAVGLVVVDSSGDIVGLVDRTSVHKELACEIAAPHPLGSDFQPPGDAVWLPPPLRVHCAECGTVNEFRRFSWIKTYPCRGGDHDLVPLFEVG
ncbi:hypothetical protein [Streptomyces sp. R35]|uniref:CBS domain-containing protein n=1 Tax=Streptomyces sp. R35 TaxID=3238630 RepID=A0AB39RXS6_9ACTN